MSTKTLRKRIALVAVSTLGAGLLSVVAVPSANASVVDKLYISNTASTTGEGVASQTLTSAGALSTGWVSKTSTNGSNYGEPAAGYTLTGGIAGSAVVLPGAQIAFALGGNTTSGTGVSLVATGATFTNVAASNSAVVSVNGTGNVITAVQPGGTATVAIGRFRVSAPAGTTATLAAYSGTGIGGLTTATNGALVGIWTFTVASASASGTYSAADSSIFQQAAVAKGVAASGTNAYDTSSRIDNGKVGVIYWSLKDAFTAPITTGTITATATNSATVNVVDAAGTADAYAATASFDTLTNTDGVGYIVVNQPVANTAGSTTVTITHNGSVLATKTLNWNGDIASITFDSANSNSAFNNGATEDSAYGWSGLVYVAKDAAGNTLNLTTLPTIDSATGALVGASLGATQNTTSGVLQTAAAGYGTATMVVPTSALNGAGTFMLKLSNSAGTSIKSAVINATVSNGSLNSFVASWDKASYAPGEIATLTVTGKDAYGNAIYDGATAAGLSLTVAGSATAGFTSVGTACTTSTAFSGGKFTCKYAANTEGAWSYSVDVTTATPQSASVGALKITAGGATSNADVLKAIVSLIASINKQIAALQKALLRR
jgi:trimeric autotransporter adhesin